MSPHFEARYPTRLSYVLKLRVDATGDALAGRLENVVTGRRIEFSSGCELLDAIAGEMQASVDDHQGE